MQNKNILKLIFSFFSRKKKLAAFAIVLAVLAFYDGANDRESMEMYLQKLQSLSEYRIDDEQKRSVTDFYLEHKNRAPNKVYRHKIRAEFNFRKHKLKQEWQARYSLTWPIENCKGMTKTFQAHHVIPINSGGINQIWNISPMADEKHKTLHASTEEHACFSQDIVERKICRLYLKIRRVFNGFTQLFEDRNQTQSLAFSKSGVPT